MNSIIQNIVIGFSDRKIFYTPTKSIPISMIDIDNPEEIIDQIKWNVFVKKIIEEKELLVVDVLSINNFDDFVPFKQEQYFKNLQIKKIRVTNISTNILLNSKKLKRRLEGGNKRKYQDQSAILFPRINHYEFKAKITDMQFIDGFFKIEKDIPIASLKNFPILIPNKSIRKEFDSIKDYFAKRLGKNKLPIRIEFTDFENRKYITVAKDLEEIDENFTESVYDDFLQRRISESTEDEINILPLDELLISKNEDGEKIEVFKEPIEKTYENIIANSKHYKYLRYLSKIHRNDIMKLRYSSKPFSFFFLVGGKDSFFIIWETLHTEEATYIWKVYPKTKESIRKALSNLDDIIKEIKTLGKRNYLMKEDENFVKINHVYSGGEQGFNRWKKQMDRLFKSTSPNIG